MAAPYRHALVRLSAVGAAALVAAGILPAAVGHAEPRPSLSSVQREVDRLRSQAAVAVEDYDVAVLALAGARSRSAAAAERLARQQARAEALRARMSEFAAAAFRGGGDSNFAELVLTGDPNTFLDRASALDEIARGRAQSVREFEAAARELAAAEVAARHEVAERQALEQLLRTRREGIERLLRAEQALLARLQVAERARLAAAQQAADRATRARAPAPPQVSSAAPGATTASRGSGRGAVAVRFAYAQLGKPYRWGAAGPGSYDCSGLTMAAWAAAGVSLPHSSRAQFGSGMHVPSSALVPGDLVFYGSPIGHVGIYIGNGLTIAAPHTGDVVKIHETFRSDYVGAVRP